MNYKERDDKSAKFWGCGVSCTARKLPSDGKPVVAGEVLVHPTKGRCIVTSIGHASGHCVTLLFDDGSYKDEVYNLDNYTRDLSRAKLKLIAGL